MNEQMTQYEKMTETPVSKLILSLSVPTILSMMITNIYNLADTAFVGQLGNSASGATGVVFGFMSIIQAVGFMFGQGSGSIVSRLLGAKDTDNASRTASTAVFWAVVSGIMITVMGFIFLDPLVTVLGSTETIKPFAKIYITYILAAAPLMTACFTMNNILRYEGKAFFGMVGLMIGGVLNIIGDAVFMFGFDMGIAGAGLSTALSQLVSFIILLRAFLAGKTQSRLSFKLISFDGAVLMNIVSTGFPSLLRQGLNSVTTVMLNDQASAYGDEAIAAMSIVSRIIFFVFSIAIGIGQGFQPVSGFNYGAKKYSRVRRAFFFLMAMSEALVAAAVMIMLVFSDELIAIFRNDPKVIEIGTRALRLQGAALLFLPPCMATEMMFQSTGHKLEASVLSALRSGLFFIPALLILAHTRGLCGIQEAQPAAFVFSCIPTVFFMIKFLKKMPSEEVQEASGKAS
ncbi:MAG: MATE family efflux transporter [Huintestinicola sp.]